VAEPQHKTISETVQDLWELLKAYAAQETIDPLRSLGHYLAWGASGSLLMALGLFFLGMSMLRALQTETGSIFTGTWSFVPYLITALALGLVIALAVNRIIRYREREHRRTV
jgi:FtsH-binding integral membrane protein